jgi:hypothetical protein
LRSLRGYDTGGALTKIEGNISDLAAKRQTAVLANRDRGREGKDKGEGIKDDQKRREREVLKDKG